MPPESAKRVVGGLPIPGTDGFRFCEPSWVGGADPWHIREISQAGEKLGGGADTPAFCGLDLNGGWDLRVKIAEGHLSHSCRECVVEFRLRQLDRKNGCC